MGTATKVGRAVIAGLLLAYVTPLTALGQEDDDLWGDDSAAAVEEGGDDAWGGDAGDAAVVEGDDAFEDAGPEETVPDEDAYDEYGEALKQYEFQIEVATLKALDEQTSSQAYADTHNIQGTILPPRLPPDQVEARIEERVQREVNQRFPESHYQKIREDAEDKFRMFAEGDKVSITVYARGDWRDVTGILEWVNLGYVKVTNKWARSDIAKQFLPRLYRADHEKAVQTYVRNETRKFNTRKADYMEGVRDKIEKAYWLRYGYFFQRSKKRYVSRDDFFREKYGVQRDDMYKALREEVAAEILTAAGWKLDETQGRWVPDQAEPEPEPEPVVTPGGPGTPPPAGTDSTLDRIKDFLKTREGTGAGAGAGAETGGGDAGLWDEDGGAEKPDEPPAKPPAKSDVSDLFDED